MKDISVFYLAVLYSLVGICMLIYETLYINRVRKLQYISCVRLMYILIYAVTPAVTHFYVYDNGNYSRKLASLDYSSGGIGQFYLMLIFSIIGYFSLSLGYNLVLKTKPGITGKHPAVVEDSKLFIAGIISFAVGLLALTLWTKAFGGIVGFLKYSSSIRSGNDVGITNSYTVFKRFAPLLMFSNFIFVGLWVKNRKFITLLFSIAAFTLSVFYLLANDGRAPFVMHIFALYLLTVFVGRKNKKTKMKPVNYVSIVIMGILAILIMHNLDAFTSMVDSSTKIEPALSLGIAETIRDEFSFTVRNAQAIFVALDEKKFLFRLPLEILSGILGILPSEFRPATLPKLEIVNTAYWSSGASIIYYGGKPPDLIVTGMYTMDLLGIFFLPLIFGIILRKIDKYFESRDMNNLYLNILFAQLIYPIVRIVGYANFDGITLSLFCIALGHITIKLLNHIKVNEKSGRRTSKRIQN